MVRDGADAPPHHEDRLFPREVEILTPRRRAVSERLLPVLGGCPDVVADNVEQLTHLDMLLDVVRERGRERAVLALAVERGLAMLGGIDHHEASGRLDV